MQTGHKLPMSNNKNEFVHVQLASIIEVLANTAVAQICKLVDDGYASLRMEISQNQREIDNLRRKLLVAKFQGSRRNHLERLALRRTVAVGGRYRASTEYCKPNRKTGMIVVDEELPVIVKVESVACNRPRDVQPPAKQDCQTNTVELSNPFKAPRSTSLCIEPDHQELNSHELNRNADQRFSALFHHVPQPTINNQQCSRDASWEGCPPSPSTNSAFTSVSQWEDDISHAEMWNNAGKFSHNPIPETPAGQPPLRSPLDRCERGQIKPGAVQGSLGDSDGAGVVVSGVMGDVVSKLDWEPHVSVVGSVPIKVEEDLHSQWNKTKGELRPGQMLIEGRCQKERQEGGKRGVGARRGGVSKEGERREQVMDAAKCPLSENTEMGDKCSEVQSAPSSSSRGDLTRLPNYLLPVAVVPQSPGSGRGNRFRCEVCGKTFTRIPLLRSHQRVHTGEKPFGCRHCSKRFSHRHQMNNHERIHTGEKPFSCPVCGRRFVQSNHMKRHLHIHTEQGSKI